MITRIRIETVSYLKSIYLFVSLIVLASCGKETQPGPEVKNAVSQHASDTTAPFFFQIIGDFNGDRKIDTLTEHIVDARTKKELYRRDFATLAAFDSLSAMIVHNEAYAYLGSSDPQLDSIPLGGAVGVHFLHNEGDLDGDGADEFSYVPQWPDMSSTNTYCLTSWKEGRWKELFGFRMWEWQLPPTPDVTPAYGYFGTTGPEQIPATYTDTIMTLLRTFSLVKKISPGMIEIQTSAERDYGDSIAIAEQMLAHVRLTRDTGSIVKVMMDTSRHE